MALRACGGTCSFWSQKTIKSDKSWCGRAQRYGTNLKAGGQSPDQLYRKLHPCHRGHTSWNKNTFFSKTVFVNNFFNEDGAKKMATLRLSRQDGSNDISFDTVRVTYKFALMAYILYRVTPKNIPNFAQVLSRSLSRYECNILQVYSASNLEQMWWILSILVNNFSCYSFRYTWK